MKKYTILSFLLIVGIHVQSQTKWTLRQCIDYAVEHNIEVKQQEIATKNAEVELSTSKNSRLPNLNARLTHDFNFGQSIDKNSNSTITKNVSSTGFSISSAVPLFTGFRISNEINQDKLDLQAATETLNKAKDNLQLQVASLYLESLFKKEILKAYNEQADLSRKQVVRTQTLVEAGKVPMSQLYDIKAQLAKDELNVTIANNDLSISLLNIAQALNIREADGFDIEEPSLTNTIESNLSSIQPPVQVYQTALTVKPHIKEAEYKLESSRKGLKVAQAGYYPTLDFNIGYSTSSQRVYNFDNMSLGDQLKDHGSRYFGFTLNIPIFNRFQVRNQVRSARLKIMNNELALENVKLDLYKEIQQAYQSAVAAQSKFNSTEKAYQAAEESFKYAQERYDVGKSTVYEFSEAQTKLLTSKSEQIQAKYDFIFRAKILDFYNGIEIDIK